MRRYCNLRLAWNTVLSNSRRNYLSQRLNSSLCLLIRMVAFPQPSGPQKSQSATMRLLKRWLNYTPNRRNLQKSRHNRVRAWIWITHKPNFPQNRRPLFPASQSLPLSMPERQGYPRVAPPELPGYEYRRRPDCLHVHCCTISSLFTSCYLNQALQSVPHFELSYAASMSR